MNNLDFKNAVAAIRVSTTKQGTDGDSPDAQKEQIERFAKDKGITIKKFFVFMESASKEQQPMQEAVDYCKNAKNGIDLFIIKSIDRFTRGGSLSYDLLKTQLEASKVNLVDIYGIISSETVNTLDHLGFEYKWSRYSPSKKSEILEAERSKDELRDIMSRMIGAEIRYTKMGYYMRQPPYGYKSVKIDTPNGKRMILQSEPEEAKFITVIFEMRAQGVKSDREISQAINDLGFKTRIQYRRSADNPHKSQKSSGGSLMNERKLWRIVRSPIYAGVNSEKWTDCKPVKCVFEGIVSVDLFNRANKGRKLIQTDPDGSLAIIEHKDTLRACKIEGGRTHEFAYRRYILCPECKKPLLGSASRGKCGKYYPAYHCSKYGHNFRVSKQNLEQAVDLFLSRIETNPEKLAVVFEKIEESWKAVQERHQEQLTVFDTQIAHLESEARTSVDKIKVLSSPTAMKYLEEDLLKTEESIKQVTLKKEEYMNKKPVDICKIIARAKYLVEHFDELLKKQIDPVKKAQFFGALFDKLPTYEELIGGTLKTPLFTGASSGLIVSNALNFPFGDLTENRTPIARMKTWCPNR
jgi:site-specific DNA recombinase